MAESPPIKARGGTRNAGEPSGDVPRAPTDRQQASQLRDVLLADGAAPERRYPAGAVLRTAGQPRNAVFVLKSGWVYSARELADGQRQILELLLPGQIVGLGEFGLDRPLSALHALNDVTVRVVGWDRIRSLLCDSPEFCEQALVVIARERLMLEERLASLGRRDSAQRLGHFLLEMHHRLRPRAERYRLPLTQQFLADLLGLTSVHVSRMLSELREAGLVDMTDQGVDLLDLDELALKTDFDPGYLAMDGFCDPDD